MLAVIFVTFLTLYIIWQAIKKPSNYPPGKWGLPLLGYFPLHGKERVMKELFEMRKKHGDVISWRFGTTLVVFVYDYKMLKDAFIGPNIVDRPDLTFFSLIKSTKKCGILSSSGIEWENARRFSLRHLRKLGMGKSEMVNVVQTEAVALVEAMKKKAGEALIPRHYISIAVLNVIWQLVAKKRYNLNDEEINKYDELCESSYCSLSHIVCEKVFRCLPGVLSEFLLKLFFNNKNREKVVKERAPLVYRYIEEHQRNLDPLNPQDYIDAYLVEMEERKEDPSSTMSIEDLANCIADLFVAGKDTTSATIKWAIFFLADNPEMQKKLQKEIDEVLPNEISATLEDRIRLPYTEATMHEVLRLSCNTDLIAIHMASKDTTIGGYTVPKGAFVLGPTSSLHKDDKYFDSPLQFRPERFLDSNGNFVNPKDGFMPFGVGKRQCIGESLARMELLIFLTTIFQRLSFASPPNMKLDLNPRENSFLNFVKDDQNILMTIR